MTCDNLDKCLESFTKYIWSLESSYQTKEEKEKQLQTLFECFDRNYSNIYEILGIEIYKLPNDGIRCEYLPDSERIQASYDTYLRTYNPQTTKESDEFNYKINLYHLLLHNRFRKLYNIYYAVRGNSNFKTVSFGKFIKRYQKLGHTKEKAIKKYFLFFGTKTPQKNN